MSPRRGSGSCGEAGEGERGRARHRREWSGTVPSRSLTMRQVADRIGDMRIHPIDGRKGVRYHSGGVGKSLLEFRLGWLAVRFAFGSRRVRLVAGAPSPCAHMKLEGSSTSSNGRALLVSPGRRHHDDARRSRERSSERAASTTCPPDHESDDDERGTYDSSRGSNGRRECTVVVGMTPSGRRDAVRTLRAATSSSGMLIFTSTGNADLAR